MSERSQLDRTQGRNVDIAACFSFSVATMATMAKIYTKWIQSKKLDWCDLAFFLSLLFSLGLLVSTREQVKSGLGQGQVQLTAGDISQFYLTSYISSLFYVLTVFVPKCAALAFFLCLTKKHSVRAFIQSTVAFIGLWMVIALLVQSFQCSVPDTWMLKRTSGTCINEMAFWTVHGVVDLTTQLLVSLIPLYLLQRIRVGFSQKVALMLSFSPNLLSTPFIVLRIVHLKDLYQSSNATYDSWTLFLISVVHANLTIVVAAIPFTKPILDALNVGIISSDVQHGVNWDRSSYRTHILGDRRSSSISRFTENPRKSISTWLGSLSSTFDPAENDKVANQGEKQDVTERPHIVKTIDTTVEQICR